MHLKKVKLSAVLLLVIGLTGLQAQNIIPAAGENAIGSGGTVSYSIGQTAYTKNTGTNGSATQWVQQPYEISVITATKNIEEINLECIVYHNPTRGIVKLVIKTKDVNDLWFQLYDLNGVLLQSKIIEAEESEILMDSSIPLIFILKVLSG